MLLALLASPVKFAVIVPAVKSPFASRATMADAVLALVAVVAELLTFPEVAMVANLESAMAADALISAFTIVPSAILALVTAPSLILAVVTALAAMAGDAAVPVKSPANWILPLVEASASGVAETTLAST